MAYFIGNYLSPTDQADLETKKLEIMSSNDTNQLKAARVQQLYDSIGVVPGTYRSRVDMVDEDVYDGSSYASGDGITVLPFIYVACFVMALIGLASIEDWFMDRGYLSFSIMRVVFMAIFNSIAYIGDLIY